MDMQTQTIALLEVDKGNWPDTADKVGVSRDWLSKLCRGLIENPGARRLARLHEYLTRKYPETADTEQAA